MHFIVEDPFYLTTLPGRNAAVRSQNEFLEVPFILHHNAAKTAIKADTIRLHLSVLRIQSHLMFSPAIALPVTAKLGGDKIEPVIGITFVFVGLVSVSS
jgi:hypothetical protein